MSSDTEEVKLLLSILGKRIDYSVDDFTGQHIAMSLYGMQKMTVNNNGDAAGLLLQLLNSRIESTEHSMTFDQIASAIFGLKVILNITFFLSVYLK
jgi:hypothetical protein